MLPPLRYRPFEEGDLHQVLNLANRALDESYEGGLFLHFARLYPEGFIVAVSGNEVVGFVMGTIQRAYEARILALAVEPEWRRRGIGTQLTERFLERFRRYGVRRVSLEVRVSNTKAISMYERLGFEKRGALEGYYNDDEDAYVMARSI